MTPDRPQPWQRRGRSFSFRLRTLLALVTGIALVLAGYVAYERWRSATAPHLRFYRVLHDSVKNGDSSDSIQALLGPGAEADQADRTLFLKAVSTATLPDGYLADDQLLVYKLGDISTLVYLQFRGGKLINHDPQEFATFQPPTSIGYAMPQQSTP